MRVIALALKSAESVFGSCEIKKLISGSILLTEMANHSFERSQSMCYNCVYFVFLNQKTVLSPQESSVHLHS